MLAFLLSVKWQRWVALCERLQITFFFVTRKIFWQRQKKKKITIIMNKRERKSDKVCDRVHRSSWRNSDLRRTLICSSSYTPQALPMSVLANIKSLWRVWPKGKEACFLLPRTSCQTPEAPSSPDLQGALYALRSHSLSAVSFTFTFFSASLEICLFLAS